MERLDARRHAPATDRNRNAILAVLQRVLPTAGAVLEIASGTGEHAVHFAAALTDILWQPSDPDPAARASISAWQESAGLANLRQPLALDVMDARWPVAHADAILCVNMIHISPWPATEALMAGASRLLAPGAPLILYGPFRRDGLPTAPSNEAFDASLKARNPTWGVRDLVAVVAAADGFRLEEVVEMPANNLTLILRRS